MSADAPCQSRVTRAAPRRTPTSPAAAPGAVVLHRWLNDALVWAACQNEVAEEAANMGIALSVRARAGPSLASRGAIIPS